MREQLAFAGDHHRVPLITDADAVDHAPEFFEVQSPDEPSFACAVLEADGDDCRGQQVVVDREVRHQGAFDVDAFGPRNLGGRRSETAGYGWPSVVVEQRELAELRELQNEVLENAV